MELSPPHVGAASFPEWGTLLLILAAVVVIARIAGCAIRSGPAISRTIFAAPVVAGLLACTWGTVEQTPPQAATLAAASELPAPTAAEVASLEDIWDQLHQVRIDLSGEEPLDDAADREAVEPAASDDSPPRPAWVDRPARRVGEVYQQKLSTGPWEEEADCHRELEAKLRIAVARRIGQLAGKLEGKPRATVPPLEELGIGMDDIIRELCSEEFVETVTTESFDNMKQVHVLMEFTAADDQQLIARWEEYRRRHRLAAVTGVAVLVVGVVSLAYGLLCLDTWTRGYYTKRLLLGVPAAIIAIVMLLS